MAKMYRDRFFCTCCGREGIPIQRKKGQDREGGHLKVLYCLSCNKETNHVEIREFDDYTPDSFKKEFEGGNFTTNGERKKTWREFIRGLNYGR